MFMVIGDSGRLFRAGRRNSRIMDPDDMAGTLDNLLARIFHESSWP
jgi:hypothetical protein